MHILYTALTHSLQQVGGCIKIMNSNNNCTHSIQFWITWDILTDAPTFLAIWHDAAFWKVHVLRPEILGVWK